MKRKSRRVDEWRMTDACGSVGVWECGSKAHSHTPIPPYPHTLFYLLSSTRQRRSPINGPFSKDIDFTLLGMTLLLMIIGVAMVYSATYRSESEMISGIYGRQIWWAILSLGVIVLAVWLPNRYLYIFAYLIFGVALALLVLVLIFGGGGGGGAKRWFLLGPIQLQPSELAKVAAVLALARYLSEKHIDLNRLRHLLIPFAMVIVPMLLITEQPDLGTALVFGAIVFPTLYWAGLRPINLFYIFSPLFSIICAFLSSIAWSLYLLSLVVLFYLARPRLLSAALLLALNIGVGAITPHLWARLHDYQQRRILTFLDPGNDPLGAGYQIIQSKVAIGSGGLFGKGFMKGTQIDPRLGFLPAQHTDFIFAVVGEEMGFLGATVILSLFLVIIWRSIRIAATTKNRFLSLTAIGLGSILTFHVFINIGMTIGLMPVTGIPLPFLSYGGSSLFTNVALVGLLLNISAKRYEY